MQITLELNAQVTNWLHSIGLVPDDYETDGKKWETGTPENPAQITLDFLYNYEPPTNIWNSYWEFYNFSYVCDKGKEWSFKDTLGKDLDVPKWLKQQLIETVEKQ